MATRALLTEYPIHRPHGLRHFPLPRSDAAVRCTLGQGRSPHSGGLASVALATRALLTENHIHRPPGLGHEPLHVDNAAVRRALGRGCSPRIGGLASASVVHGLRKQKTLSTALRGSDISPNTKATLLCGAHFGRGASAPVAEPALRWRCVPRRSKPKCASYLYSPLHRRLGSIGVEHAHAELSQPDASPGVAAPANVCK